MYADAFLFFYSTWFFIRGYSCDIQLEPATFQTLSRTALCRHSSSHPFCPLLSPAWRLGTQNHERCADNDEIQERKAGEAPSPAHTFDKWVYNDGSHGSCRVSKHIPQRKGTSCLFGDTFCQEGIGDHEDPRHPEAGCSVT